MRPLFLLLIAAFLNAATITLVAERNCPYSCVDSGKDKGFVIDIASYVFSQMGYKVEYKNIESKEKALEGLRSKEYDALIGISPKEAPDLIFSRYALAYSHDVIVVPKYSKWKYTSPASLDVLTLGVIDGYDYDDVINDHVLKHKDDKRKVQVVGGKYASKDNLKKLRYDKITALIDNQHRLQYFYAKKKKLFPFKVAKKLNYSEIRIAFSPKDYKAKQRARSFSHELNKLQGSPQMQSILKRYGLIERNILPPQKKR